MLGGLTREGDSLGLGHMVDSEDISEGSSVSTAALQERGGEGKGKGKGKGEGEGEEESVALEREGKSKLEDPDKYGELLVDESGQQETGEADVEKVS